MRLSIALATCNGSRHLSKQLESFLSQTRLPDEVVVFDDRSDDDTVSTLEQFADKAPFEVRIAVNEKRVGVRANFERAIVASTGDVIALSDQDDRWLDNKLERLETVLAASPHLVVINDAVIANRELEPTGDRLSARVVGGGRPIDDFITGCCSAFLSKLKPLLLPLPDEYTHDAWLHRVAQALDARVFLDEPLQLYRRHEATTSDWILTRTAPPSSADVARAYLSDDPLSHCEQRLERLRVLDGRLRSRADVIGALGKTRGPQLDAEIAAASLRIEILRAPRHRRPRRIARLARSGGYAFFSGWRSAVRDLAESRGGRL